MILINGPRQCGKTTLSKTLIDDSVNYLSLDNEGIMKSAKDDPISFIQHPERLMIIDEVQRVPELLMSIKLQVDEDTRPGQFLLTGSANIQSLPNVKESLAGRIRKIRLRFLSQGEIRGCTPHFVEKAFSQDFEKRFSTFNRRSITERALKGGFPETLMLDAQERRLWHKDYIDSLIEKDLKELTDLRRLDAMKKLVEILAAWSGKFIDISKISSHLSIQRATVENYIYALENLYLFEMVNPWRKTDYDRVGKTPKLYVTDSGLMSSLLDWNMKQIWLDSDRIGKLFECFVFNELSALIDADPGKYRLYHYRDGQKREIDFLIERESQSLLGVEVKASSVVGKKDFKHLDWFQKNLAKNNDFVGIVLYSGEHLLPFGENMWAVPMSALWH